MRSTIGSLLSLSIAVAVAVYGLWIVYGAFAPVPDRLETSIGVVTRVQTHTDSDARGHATFSLKQADGSATEFSYKPRHARFYYFARHVKPGMKVEVTTGPGGKHDIWGLKLASRVLMTPDEARQARKAEWKGGLILFVASLILAVCLLPAALRP